METLSLSIIKAPIPEDFGMFDELIQEHWEESAKNKELMILKPRYDVYRDLDNKGALINLFAFVDGKVVGYSVNILSNHLHYADLSTAMNDIIFISKPYRDTPLGLRLIHETEKACKEAGVKLMLWHAKEDSALAKILPRRKCKVQDIVFSKQL